MGRRRHWWSPPVPPHPAWLFYTVTSEKLNSEKTLSVLPCFFACLSSPMHVCVREKESMFMCDVYS